MKYSSSPTLFLPALLIVFLAISSNGISQCVDIDLNTQSDVNNFKNTGCTTVSGILEIRGTGITNLDSLEGLTHVGHLSISETSLQNLEGLHNLVKVDRFLSISLNAQLVNLNGIENVQEVGALYVSEKSNNSQKVNVTNQEERKEQFVL